MKRILIVDDDLMICRVYSMVLDGFDCESAKNAFEALGILFGQGKEFDLIIVDLIMPGLDGASFVKIVRMVEDYTPRHHRRRIIISTGFSVEHVGAERILHEVDCDGFLSKPIDNRILIAVANGAPTPS